MTLQDAVSITSQAVLKLDTKVNAFSADLANISRTVQNQGEALGAMQKRLDAALAIPKSTLQSVRLRAQLDEAVTSVRTGDTTRALKVLVEIQRELL